MINMNSVICLQKLKLHHTLDDSKNFHTTLPNEHHLNSDKSFFGHMMLESLTIPGKLLSKNVMQYQSSTIY